MASTVAVAGGTGRLGRTVTEQLCKETDYRIIILTRSDPRELKVKFSQIDYVQVDYDDIPSVARELDRQNVSTLICNIGMYAEDQSVAQRNLIQAAIQSTAVKRFIPSEFGYLTREDNKDVDPGVQWHLKSAELLRESDLIYTRIVCGAFMDYLGMPHVRSNLAPFYIAIDVENCIASIPGDGNNAFNVVYSYDVATMVAKLLSLDDWPEFSNCAADTITFNEIVRIAEEVRGKKFHVTYTSKEDIAKGNMAVIPAPAWAGITQEEFTAFNLLAATLIVSAASRLPPTDRLWSRFPDFRPKSVREFITDVWKGR